jgi:hypothetical protein
VKTIDDVSHGRRVVEDRVVYREICQPPSILAIELNSEQPLYASLKLSLLSL